jgi:hypothetical protein
VKPQVAASMKRLLAEAKTGARPRLVNMTRIDGYTLEIDDIVLWGRSEPKESELPFDDLMVAFKSIRGAYGKGIPGVDLNMKDDAEFRKRSAEIVARGDDRAYKRLCMETPCLPSVIALPRDSRVSKILLDADYDMKLMSNGTKNFKIRNPIRAFTLSYVDLLRKISSGKASSAEKEEARLISAYPNSRRWFHPGRMSYVRDENSVFIDCVQILLSARNRDADGNPIEVTPILQRFACSWSNRMDEIIDTESSFKGMRSIFRMFALARIIDQNQDTFRLADRQVIDDYLVPMTAIPSEYGSIVSFVQLPDNRKGRLCGGVRINYLNVEGVRASNMTKFDTDLLGKKALEGVKGCKGESCWRVE